jgi:hypothetical protein
MRRTFIIFLALLLTSVPVQGQTFGTFNGEVVAEWMPGSRKMTLREDFGYVDPTGVLWSASKGSIVDGASIPWLLWTVVGSPYTGNYRKASVVHDVACDRKDHTWQSTHRMFYNAMRLGGTSETRAKVMYAAVYHFGPRWGQDTSVRRFTSDEDLMRMRQYVEERPSMSLEAIEDLTREVLLQLHPVIRAEMRRPPPDSDS